MIKFKLLTLSLLAVDHSLMTAHPLGGGYITSMANAGVALQSIWSCQHNQAGLARIQRSTIALAYQNHLVAKDLCTKAAAFCFPFKNSVWGLSFQSYGLSSVYHDQKFSLALAKRLGSKFTGGVNVSYHYLKIQNYGSRDDFSMDMGVQYYFHDNFVFGAHIAHVNQVVKEPSNRSAAYSLGVAHVVSDKVTATGALYYIDRGAMCLKTGIAYQCVPLLNLCAGISTNPLKHYAGFSFYYRVVTVDFAVTIHPYLGCTPQIAMAYEL